jgi:hypothetical protein
VLIESCLNYHGGEKIRAGLSLVMHEGDSTPGPEQKNDVEIGSKPVR